MTAAYLRGPSVQPVRLEACLTALSLTDAVRAAPASCRDASVTGPRLLLIASASGNQVLAFGSGQWAWLDRGVSQRAPNPTRSRGGSVPAGPIASRCGAGHDGGRPRCRVLPVPSVRPLAHSTRNKGH